MAVKVQGLVSRHLFEGKGGIYYKGQQAVLLARNGDVIIGDDLPDVPAIISTIADREYTVGGSAVTIDLATKFAGATSYTVIPTPAGVSLAGAILTINPTTVLAQTTITVRGVNAGGQSEPLTFALTVRIPAPTLTAPLPDVSRTVGAANLVVDLREHFAGATSYAASPTAQGVSVSGYNLTISAASARNTTITVTATNAGGSVSDAFALVVAVQPALAATITPNPPLAGEALGLSWTGEQPSDISVVLDGVYLVPDGDGLFIIPSTGGTLVITGSRPGYTSFTATFEVEPAVTPDFNVTVVEGQVSINNATGNVTVDWTGDPVAYQGVHTLDQSVEHSGPLNGTYYTTTAPQIVVKPMIARVAGPDDTVGATYRVTVPPLVLHEADNGPLTVALEWCLNDVATGVDAAGDYFSDDDGTLTVRATVSQPDLATRTAASNSIAIAAAPVGTRTVFEAPNGTLFSAFVDTTGGRAFTTTGVGSTKIDNNYPRGKSGAIYPGFIKAGDVLDADQWASTWVDFAETLPANMAAYTMLPAVGCAAGSSRQGYVHVFGNNRTLALRRSDTSSTNAVLKTTANDFLNAYAGQKDVEFRLERIGADFKTYVNDVHIPSLDHTDTTYTGGFAGLATIGTWPSGEDLAAYGTKSFDCGSL